MNQTNIAAARRAMIDSQLRTSGINEPLVLARMSALGREDFLPQSLRAAAYADRAVRLPDGGAMAAPLFYGALLTEARPVADDRVLVIDGGSGYLSALVKPLVSSVKEVSATEAIAGKLRGTFTLVLVDGAVENWPVALAKLLAPEGRLVTGVVDHGVTRLAAGRLSGKDVAILPLQEMGIPRLAVFDLPKAWSF